MKERVYSRLRFRCNAINAERGGIEVDCLLKGEGYDGGVVELDELRELSEVLGLLRHLASDVPSETHDV